MQQEIEHWIEVSTKARQVKVYASSLGCIKTVTRLGREVIVKGSIGKRYGKPRYRKTAYGYVHRLVALHFVPNPYSKPTVNHIDGNKLNNRADNLEWMTVEENIEHSVLIGTAKRGTKPKAKKIYNRIPLHLNKLKRIAVQEIGTNGEIIASYPSVKIAALETGIGYSSIYALVMGERKSIKCGRMFRITN